MRGEDANKNQSDILSRVYHATCLLLLRFSPVHSFQSWGVIKTLWDLKIVDAKGASIEWEELDLTKISEVTLHYQNGKAWADVK